MNPSNHPCRGRMDRSNFREIVLRLENVLARRRHWQAVSGCVSMGRKSIDFDAQEIRSGRCTHRLGAREAALLRFLLARRGMVVSRDETLDEVWSPDEYPSPRTVDNFIVKPRHSLGESPRGGFRPRWRWPGDVPSGQDHPLRDLTLPVPDGTVPGFHGGP